MTFISTLYIYIPPCILTPLPTHSPSASQVGSYVKEGVLIPEIDGYVPRIPPPPPITGKGSASSVRRTGQNRPNLVDRLAVVMDDSSNASSIDRYDCVTIKAPPSYSIAQ